MYTVRHGWVRTEKAVLSAWHGMYRHGVSHVSSLRTLLYLLEEVYRWAQLNKELGLSKQASQPFTLSQSRAGASPPAAPGGGEQ